MTLAHPVVLRLSASMVIALSLVPALARADMTKVQCIDANGQAQELRRQGKFAAAREQLRACGSPSCPGLIRDDCAKRLDELERAQPAIVFDAKDASGRDVSQVKITVDGRVLTERLDGTALPVDPGEHVFVFSVAGQSPLAQTFLIKEGDRERRERIVLGVPIATPATPALAPAPAPSPPAPVTSPSPASEGSASAGDADAVAGEPSSTGGGIRARKISGLIAGGLGVAGVAVGAVFGLKTSSASNQQKSDCPSAMKCPNPGAAQSEHSTMVTDGTVADVAFIAGGALVAAGVLLILVGGDGGSAQTPASLRVAPIVALGRGGVALGGEF